MVEVVFNESAAGSLTCAMGRGGRLGGATGVIFLRSDGEKPSRAEVRRAQREAEARERRNRAEAVPLEGRREDVVPLSLLLSAGDIRGNGMGPARSALLKELYPDQGERMEALVERTRRNLAQVLERAGQGDPVRVWSSQEPDEACGLYWLMEQLRPLGFEKVAVTLVRLPAFQARDDGTAVWYRGWGEVEPHQWGRLAALGEKLPLGALRGMANRWRQLQEENAPLRAVLNGRLVSAPETLYDPYILRELEGREGEFPEAAAVGDVIGKYQLGIGDGWIARRIEVFVQEGLLEAVTEAKPGDPPYRRRLRRRPRGAGEGEGRR